MDSKRVDRGGARQQHQSSESSPTRPSPSPPPPPYSSSFSASDNSYNYNEKRNKNVVGIGNVSRRSKSVSPSSQETHRSSNNKYSRGDSPFEGRRKTRRSRSRSSSARSHKRSRSRDKDNARERESYKERSRKYSKRDRQSRSRSRSKERRRSRSRNKSRDKHRFRESRRYHRQASYESDVTHDDLSETVTSQSMIIAQPNAFKNDGSFMEMFKKMQEQMQPALPLQQQPATSFSSVSASSTVLQERTAPPPPLMVGKRRGGRILKTGMVAKPKSEPTADQPTDAWSLYMAEVKKYRELNYRSTMPDAITVDQLKTAPYDPRFPNQNQTRYCYQSYVDFHRCSKIRGEDFEACQYYKRVFTSICPNAWIEKWNEQLEEGRFPGNI